MIKISPSVLSCDFSKLGDEITGMQKAGAQMIHLDIMDGHFVPNISFGAPIIASVRNKTDIFFDTHLMISNPLKYAKDFAQAGSDRITFHIESDDKPAEVIKKLQDMGVETGISLKPATPATAVMPYLKELQQVLVMTVEPGFGGQSFMEDMCSKILALAKYKQEYNLDFDIQVDGGINLKTAPIATAHGANVLVAGSALYAQANYQTAVQQLKEAAQKGLLNKLF